MQITSTTTVQIPGNRYFISYKQDEGDGSNKLEIADEHGNLISGETAEEVVTFMQVVYKVNHPDNRHRINGDMNDFEAMIYWSFIRVTEASEG